MKIQQFFEDWVISHCQSDFPVILVSANGKNITSYIPWSGGDVTAVPSFRNDHEEADDWMMYHVNQAINEKAIIALKRLSLLPLTEMFLYVLSTISTNLLWLKKMWVISGRSGATSRFYDSSLLHQDVLCVFIPKFRRF